MKQFFKTMFVGAAFAACAMSASAAAPEAGKSYSIKFLSNDNYLSNVGGSFRCAEGLSAGGFWTIEAATSGEGYYLYNPVAEVYVFRGSDGWTMSTSTEATETSNFDFVAVDDMEDTYILAMLDNGKYVGADSPLSNGCAVYGDKSWDFCLEKGLVQFELLPFDPSDMELVYNMTKEQATAYVAELEKDAELAAFVKRSAEYEELDRCMGDTPTEWSTGYEELNSALVELKSAVTVYKNYMAAVKFATNLKKNAVLATAEAVAGLDEALGEDLEDGFDAEDVQDSIDWVYEACRAVVETNAVCAKGVSVENKTELIQNPDATTNEEWTLEATDLCDFEELVYDANKSGEGPTMSDDEVIEFYWDGWSGSAGWGTDFYQMVTLPAGDYRLSVLGRSSVNSFVKYALYAGAEETAIPQLGNQGNVFGKGWGLTYVDFTLAAETPVQLGTIAATNLTGSWASFVKFQLVKFDKEASLASVKGIAADDNAAPVYYNLQGVKVANPENGIFIVRKGGKSYKTVVK